jgi:hypothetical protein
MIKKVSIPFYLAAQCARESKFALLPLLNETEQFEGFDIKCEFRKNAHYFEFFLNLGVMRRYDSPGTVFSLSLFHFWFRRLGLDEKALPKPQSVREHYSIQSRFALQQSFYYLNRCLDSLFELPEVHSTDAWTLSSPALHPFMSLIRAREALLAMQNRIASTLPYLEESLAPPDEHIWRYAKYIVRDVSWIEK